MKVLKHPVSRRSLLAGAATAAIALASRPFGRQAQATVSSIVAKSVAKVPSDPEDALWNQAQAATIAMFPQNIVLPRLKEAGAKALNIRSLYDPDRVGLLLEWQDAHKDTELGTVLQYRDGAAVQFPEDPSPAPPSFTMGEKGKGVVIYHWKSDWQFQRLYDVDEAHPNMYAVWYPLSGVPAGTMPEATDYLTRGRKEYLTAAAVGNALADPQMQEKIGPVQKMRAEGFGTIEPNQTQDGQGKGVWRDGAWRIAISIPRKQAKFTFTEGTSVPLAFAAWDGSRKERNGQKAYSVWNSLSLGAPPAQESGRGVSLPLVGSLAGVAVAAVAVLFGLRMRRRRQQPGRQ